MGRTTALCGLIIACLVLSTSRLAAGSYRVTDLGALNGTAFHATDINNSGMVAGYLDYNMRRCRLAVWDKGKISNLEAADYDGRVEIAAINDAGEIVGAQVAPGAITVIGNFTWKNKVFGSLCVGETWTDANDTPHPGDSGCSDINNKDWICGWAERPGGARAFIWKSGRVTYLPSTTLGYGIALNSHGDVAGHLRVSEDTQDESACLWRGGRLIRLKGLGGKSSTASGINDRGQAIGTSENRKGHNHALLWQQGRTLDLGTLGGRKSEAKAINNKGSIVGYAEDGKGRSRAVIWTGLRIRDLNSLLPAGTGWVLKEAVSINDRGQIIGDGTHLRRHRSFLLTPVR